MNINDIQRLIKHKAMLYGTIEKDTSRILFTEEQLDLVSQAIAAELSLRFTRPVVTITRADIMTAAHIAGFQMKTTEPLPGVQSVTPVDALGNDVYDKLHTISDFFMRTLMERLPEAELSKELTS